MRIETRKERYESKNAQVFPLALCTTNFEVEGNLGFAARAAGCFGAQELLVLGRLPKPHILKALSGGVSDYVDFKTFANPRTLLEYARNQAYQIISLDLTEQAKPLYEYKFSRSTRVLFVVGNESTGIPIEILLNSQHLYIPMPGPGWCLNTSQAANIALYEYTRQMSLTP